MTVFRDYHNLVQKPRESYDASSDNASAKKCLDNPPRNPNPPELLEVILAGESRLGLLPPVPNHMNPHPHLLTTPPSPLYSHRHFRCMLLPTRALTLPSIYWLQVSILLIYK